QQATIDISQLAFQALKATSAFKVIAPEFNDDFGDIADAADADMLTTTMSDALAAYAIVTLADQLGEAGYELAAGLGADTNNAAARGWEKFDDGFNTYATPTGWATLLADASGLGGSS